MPPSAVFSYWRREHRRQALPGSNRDPSSATPTHGTNFAELPPRLPELPETSTHSDVLNDSSRISNRLPSNFLDQSPIPSAEYGSGSVDANLSQISTNLQHPLPPYLEKITRPHSSAEERPTEEETLYTVQNRSQQSLVPLRTGLADTYAPKPIPARPSESGKPGVNFRVEEHGGVGGQGSSLRGLTSGESPVALGGGAPREYKFSKEYGFPKDYKVENMIVTQRAVQSEFPSDQGHQKPGKTVLNLLNPMSLLARRRASQVTNSRPEDVNFVGHKLVPAIPDDYDPRIRGHIVHDFSAPRPRRQLVADQDKATREGSAQELSSSRRHDVSRPRNEHSPIFREHFGEEYPAIQIEKNEYLRSPPTVYPTLNDNESTKLSVFMQKLPIHLAENEKASVEQFADSAARTDKPENPRAQSPPALAPILKASPPRQNQTVTPSNSQRSTAGPNRLKSNASRFSFDMNGIGSSVQERLLEEKHKEKEAARKERARLDRFDDGDFDDDDFDYDAMDDMGGLEERIPGVNADADEDEFSNFSGFLGVAQPPLFAPSLPTIAASPQSPNMPLLPFPQDAHRHIAGHEASSTFSASDSASDYGDSLPENPHDSLQHPSQPSVANMISTEVSTISNKTTDEDDLYFDDGGFGEISAIDQDEGFDESVFDDESNQFHNHQFYPGTKISITTRDNSISNISGHGDITAPLPRTTLQPTPSLVSQARESMVFLQGDIVPPSICGDIPSRATPGILTERNLEALHTALARVADEAATVKRLQRNTSLSDRSLGQESLARISESHPGLVSDDSRLSQAMDTMEFEDAFDDFNYDDNGYDDDPIIAEANAEALENDDEGFYGQEFGFYARSHLDCDAEPVHGGFFGPPDVAGVHPHSGRANFREPSLTPITERSEYSTRNSIISLSAYGVPQSNTSGTGPGLAQLVDMGNLGEEMSLEALMRLRRGAFGGSNGSLRSSASSLSPQTGPTGSLNRGSGVGVGDLYRLSVTSTELPTLPLNDPVALLNGYPSCSASLLEGGWEGEEEKWFDKRSPTSNSIPTPTRGSTGDGEVARSGTGKTNRSSHSRASSSASISYTKEVDDDGSSKWILERRRTGDSGEMEVYEREVLEEGRI